MGIPLHKLLHFFVADYSLFNSDSPVASPCCWWSTTYTSSVHDGTSQSTLSATASVYRSFVTWTIMNGDAVVAMYFLDSQEQAVKVTTSKLIWSTFRKQRTMERKSSHSIHSQSIHEWIMKLGIKKLSLVECAKTSRPKLIMTSLHDMGKLNPIFCTDKWLGMKNVPNTEMFQVGITFNNLRTNEL
jgi:hypothetical protein